MLVVQCVEQHRRHVQTYLSAFFSLPIVRGNGEKLTHEEVINRLDDETVSYDVGLGVSGAFAETLRVSIKVETAAYETAVAWLRDLVYGAVFTKERSVGGIRFICKPLINPQTASDLSQTTTVPSRAQARW